MEGFIKVYWDGDIILWKNFIKHYLYTMANSVITDFLDVSESKNKLTFYLVKRIFHHQNIKNFMKLLETIFFMKTREKFRSQS